MKLFIDDIRQAPSDDWVVARTVTEAIRLLAKFDVKEISLDHDISHQISLGNNSRPFHCEECFCAVAYYIGMKYLPVEPDEIPQITIHTASPVGAEEMKNILKDYGLVSIVKPFGMVNRLEMEVGK